MNSDNIKSAQPPVATHQVLAYIKTVQVTFLIKMDGFITPFDVPYQIPNPCNSGVITNPNYNHK
jgi:hypothetical protein